MDSRLVCYDELGGGYGVIVISRDWIRRLVALNFAKKNLTVPSFADLS